MPLFHSSSPPPAAANPCTRILFSTRERNSRDSTKQCLSTFPKWDTTYLDSKRWNTQKSDLDALECARSYSSTVRSYSYPDRVGTCFVLLDSRFCHIVAQGWSSQSKPYVHPFLLRSMLKLVEKWVLPVMVKDFGIFWIFTWPWSVVFFSVDFPPKKVNPNLILYSSIFLHCGET